MKPRSLSWQGVSLGGLAMVLLVTQRAHAGSGQPSVAFFYGTQPPVAELSLFDRVVLEPGHARPRDREALARAGTEVLAYFSVGEVSTDSPWHAQLLPGWLLGKNAGWGGDILDPSQEAVRAFLLAQQDALWRDGYRAFFLDTLDSPLGAPGTAREKEARRQGLLELLRAMHRRHPGLALMFNRGFELLPEAAPLCRGVAAESLFDRWDAVAQRYTPVPPADRVWLTVKLTQVRARDRLPVVVIDYVPPGQRDHARQTARAIQGLGFVAYVSNAELNRLGVGEVEVVRRRVLALYDGAAVGEAVNSPAHRLLTAPLEYLGYAVDAVDVRTLPGPEAMEAYAGVVAWFTVPVPEPERYRAWLLQRLDAGTRVALFGQLGVPADQALLQRLGLASAGPVLGALRISTADGLTGFEAAPRPHPRAPPPFRAQGEGVTAHLALSDGEGARAAVLTAPWGGLALEPYVVEEGYQGRLRWTVDPFAFLREALALPPLPAPDVTTESGRRVLTAHVDADGCAASAAGVGAPGQSCAGEVISRFLEQHPLPVTVSFAGGGLSATEASPAPGLAAAAKRLARVPWVEVASHPMEGGFSQAAPGPFSLTDVSPLGGGAPARLYRPGVDERAFTEPGLGTPAGYERVIEVLGSTGAPRRLAPLGLSFHFGSGVKPGGVKALEQVYRWAGAQEPLPLWLSEYAALARDFDTFAVGRTLDGGWELRGGGALRTVRLEPSLGYPDLARSRGVAGMRELPQGRYVALDGRGRVSLALAQVPPSSPHLRWANARVLRWEPGEGGIALRLAGHQPVRFGVAGAEGRCALRLAGRTVAGVAGPDGTREFRLEEGDTGDATLDCS